MYRNAVVLELNIKSSEYDNIFGGIALQDLKNHVYEMKLTDDPVKDLLNTK